MSQMIKLPQQEMSVEALKALIAEAEARKPIEGQEYTLKVDTTLAAYRLVDGKWQWRDLAKAEWHTGNSSLLNEYFSDGRLVPYTPPPTFQVGQWVVPYGESDLPAVQITGIGNGVVAHYYRHNGATHHSAHVTELRLATPEEIAAATRIQPKVGMLLKRKSDGAVFRIEIIDHDEWAWAGRLDQVEQFRQRIFTVTLSSEAYEVLPSYALQGVR